VKSIHAVSVAVIEHAECSMITLIRDVTLQRVNASLAKTQMTGRRASMLNHDAWSCGIGSRSEQAAYLCAANVAYANEMPMNNHLFTLLMTAGFKSTVKNL
jgi:hypothetical protein